MSHNTWIHKASRIVIVKPLLSTKVTPNQLTSARLISGLIAACLLGFESSEAKDLGALIFVLAMLLDRADGDLARLSGQTSEFGHTFDLISDAICNSLIFVGLGVGLRSGEFGVMAIPMGLVAGLAVILILFFVFKVEKQDGPRAAEFRGWNGVDVDDAVIAVPILIWLGAAEKLLIAAAFGAPFFAIFFICKFMKKEKMNKP